MTLTVTSGAIFANASGGLLTLQGGGTLVLGNTVGTTGPVSEGIFTTVGGAALSISSTSPVTLTGPAATLAASGGGGTDLTLAGGGSFSLPSVNSLGAGQTTLAGSTLNLANSTSLGSGALTLVSGTLSTTTSGGLLLNNPLTLSNSTVSLGTVGSSNPILFSSTAAVTLAGTTDTLTVNAPSTAFDAVVSGSANFTKAGTGTLVLTAANTYTGLTFVTAGIVQALSATALGASTTNAVIVSSGASVQVLGSGLTINKPLILNGSGYTGTSGALENLIGGNNTWTGNITLQTGGSTIAADNGTTLSIGQTATSLGTISGTGSLTKAGTGQLTLFAPNAYFGNTSVNAGVLNVSNTTTGLGAAAGSVTVASGATLQLSSGVTVYGKQLHPQRHRVRRRRRPAPGALATTSGAVSTWTGDVTLTGTGSGAAAIGAIGSSGTLTLTGVRVPLLPMATMATAPLPVPVSVTSPVPGADGAAGGGQPPPSGQGTDVAEPGA